MRLLACRFTYAGSNVKNKKRLSKAGLQMCFTSLRSLFTTTTTSDSHLLSTSSEPSTRSGRNRGGGGRRKTAMCAVAHALLLPELGGSAVHVKIVRSRSAPCAFLQSFRDVRMVSNQIRNSGLRNHAEYGAVLGANRSRRVSRTLLEVLQTNGVPGA